LIMKVLKLQKWCEVFQLSFHKSNLKSWSPKKMSLKGIMCVMPISLWLFKIYSTIFFKWISNVIFSPRSSVFEAHFHEPSILWEVKIAMGTLHKILNRIITIIHFLNQIFDAQIGLQIELFKNRNLVRFY